MAQAREAIGQWVDLLFAGLKPAEISPVVVPGGKPPSGRPVAVQPKAAK